MMLVQQVPAPPAPPEVPGHIVLGPEFWTGDDIVKILVISMMGLAVVVWLIARGPIGMAIGAAIRKMARADQPASLPGELDALRSEVDGLRRQLGEMAERQDFSERMLAQVRRERLPGPQDVAG
jgi:hypothetical protein